MPLFPKNIMHFGFFFTNEMECERGKQDFSNKVIILNVSRRGLVGSVLAY